jgi:hypothetical protein
MRIRDRDGYVWHSTEPAPTRYRTTSGGFADIPEAGEYRELGLRPTCSTRWQRFGYHIHHGRIMRYPWAAVIAFAVRCWPLHADDGRPLPWFRERR